MGKGNAALEWAVTAGVDLVLGFLVGLVLIPIGTKIVAPIYGSLFGGKAEAH